MAIAPVLKTGARKGLGVRIPRPPLDMNNAVTARAGLPPRSHARGVAGAFSDRLPSGSTRRPTRSGRRSPHSTHRP